eukprot:5666200-Pleurochrysis_carterae.AAC.1
MNFGGHSLPCCLPDAVLDNCMRLRIFLRIYQSTHTVGARFAAAAYPDTECCRHCNFVIGASGARPDYA